MVVILGDFFYAFLMEEIMCLVDGWNDGFWLDLRLLIYTPRTVAEKKNCMT